MSSASEIPHNGAKPARPMRARRRLPAALALPLLAMAAVVTAAPPAAAAFHAPGPGPSFLLVGNWHPGWHPGPPWHGGYAWGGAPSWHGPPPWWRGAGFGPPWHGGGFGWHAPPPFWAHRPPVHWHGGWGGPGVGLYFRW